MDVCEVPREGEGVMMLTLIALPTPPLAPYRLRQLAREYAALTMQPLTDRTEEQMSAIIALVPVEQRRALHRLVREG